MDDTAHDKKEADLQRQIDAISGRVADNRSAIDALRHRADSSATAANVNVDRADADRKRIDELEAAEVIDREMIAELHADGILHQEHAAQMKQALLSSRIIGAAIGIIMANRQLSQEDAFAVLLQASRQSNRKLRDIAVDVVSAKSAHHL